MEIEDYAQNIEAVIARATKLQVHEGMTWYQSAHYAATLCASRGKARGESLARRTRAWAGVLAALSPNVGWERNLSLALRAAHKGFCDGGTYGANCDKANRIINGEDPEDVLSGPKVTAFFRLIADPTNDTDVCVDRHAAHIAWGEIVPDAERENRLRRQKGAERTKIINAYKLVAYRRGILPSQAQAIAWVRHRSELLGES